MTDLTDEQLADLERLHTPCMVTDAPDDPRCFADGQPWPCTESILLGEVRRWRDGCGPHRKYHGCGACGDCRYDAGYQDALGDD